ncbi:MAG: hypothetical protein QXW98_06565, partial [Candidatus Caldarchaeum sp.]
KYGLPLRTLQRRSAQEGWPELRRQAQAEIALRVREELVQRVTKKIVAAYDSAIEGGLEYMQIGRALLRPLVQFQSLLSGDSRLDLDFLRAVSEIGATAQRMHGGGWNTLRTALSDLIELQKQALAGAQQIGFSLEESTKRVIRLAGKEVIDAITQEAPTATVEELVRNLALKRREVLIQALEGVLSEEAQRESAQGHEEDHDATAHAAQ